jgi:protein-L-isoaspartate O-methyltransferase
MKKTIYKEPAFLKDIHRNQISNYEKTKSLTVQERISQLVKQAHQNLEKLKLRTIEFTQK